MIETKYEIFISKRVDQELMFYNQRVRYNGADQVYGVSGVLSGNINIKMCYGMDSLRGFHVEAEKKGERRIYVLKGTNPHTGARMKEGAEWYGRALYYMHCRVLSDGEQLAVGLFLSGIM